MNYQEFKDHLITFLWKKGDQVLIDSLDNLVDMADAELRKVLKADLRETMLTTNIEDQDTTLPAGTHSVRSVVMNDWKYKEFRYVEPARIMEARARNRSQSWLDQYSIVGRQLLLCGPVDSSNPQEFFLNLITAIPDFKALNTSWVADDHIDLYTYAVLKHSSTFLREDERLPVWQGLFADALLSANEAFAFNEQRGVYASKQLPYQSSVPSRRRV